MSASFDDDVIACAKIVETGDPMRFRTVMAAPVAARAKLFPLYAFNIEVSRAPWVTQEPMIAEMRLQWWRDALDEIVNGGPVRRHEVVTPLARVLTPGAAQRLDRLIEARRWDVYRVPFETEAAQDQYLEETTGALTWTAGEMLGAGADGPLRDAGWGMGMAAFLQAVPALKAAGRQPLRDETPAAIAALAARGVARLAAARRGRVKRAALPALWPASGALRVLQAAKAAPERVLSDGLPEYRLRLAWNAMLRRW
ncbi:MAG: squalene/phytoene synthase family protein [Rhodobacteraceae bacterium]|nr:squalene/phytoene synthase family protein [Paracoccaceae bacterium]